MSAEVIPLASPLAVESELVHERRSDIVYYGGDATLSVQYGGHVYDLLPQTPVRIPPRLDYPQDKLTGRRLLNMPRKIVEGGDGASIAAELQENYANQGVCMLYQDDDDSQRMEEARRRSISFRVAQANNVKAHWLRQLDKVRAGALPPPQPDHVRQALDFLHKQASSLGHKRFVTRDGRSFDSFEEAASHLETLWPEMIQAAGSVEALITDREGGRNQPGTQRDVPGLTHQLITRAVNARPEPQRRGRPRKQ